jgi:hypothetical protein
MNKSSAGDGSYHSSLINILMNIQAEWIRSGAREKNKAVNAMSLA